MSKRLSEVEISREIADETQPTPEEMDEDLFADEFGPSGVSIFTGERIEEVLGEEVESNDTDPPLTREELEDDWPTISDEERQGPSKNDLDYWKFIDRSFNSLG